MSRWWHQWGNTAKTQMTAVISGSSQGFTTTSQVRSWPLSHVTPRSVPHRPHHSPPYRHFARAKNLLNTICILHHCNNPNFIYAVLLNEKKKSKMYWSDVYRKAQTQCYFLVIYIKNTSFGVSNKISLISSVLHQWFNLNLLSDTPFVFIPVVRVERAAWAKNGWFMKRGVIFSKALIERQLSGGRSTGRWNK